MLNPSMKARNTFLLFYYAAGTLLVSPLFMILFLGCNQPGNDRGQGQSKQFGKLTESEMRVEIFCGNCHPLPNPNTFPKSMWPEEVERGFRFYHESGRTDLEEPLQIEAEKYYVSRSPEKVEIPSAETFPVNPTDVQFVPSPLVFSGDPISLTADIYWQESSETLFFSDMANSKLRSWMPNSDPEFKLMPPYETWTLSPENVVAQGNHLCRITPCDWNQDGHTDFLVAEIGSMVISDQKLGNVVLLISKGDGTFDRHVLATELARPVVAVPFDYSDDGRMDIVIAEFGYNREGCLSLLRNIADANTTALSPADFQYEIIDSRHGHLAVIVEDMNNDGKLDLVTALGQEYESVEIRYALGGGEYRREIVMALPDPSYNTSSIHICDINQDGNKDILHTCGDIFDSFVPKPFHGVRLLVNRGGGRWETREIGMMIGAMQVVTGDFDLDGDIDIAAVGLFPGSETFSPDVSLDSVVWWEQTGDLEFVRHSIERDRCLHSSCVVADVDGDGRPDLVVGDWAEGDIPSSLTIFWNRKSDVRKPQVPFTFRDSSR